VRVLGEFYRHLVIHIIHSGNKSKLSLLLFRNFQYNFPMAKEYKTPGVYVEEISTFPPSVAEAETATAIFIGYTEKAVENGADLLQTPKQIRSLLEYQIFFGGASNATSSFCLYENVQLFFENGGGNCYIISTGSYISPVSFAELDTGLANSRIVPAAILAIPDAVYLSSVNEFFTLQKKMLQQCADLKTRFAILDTRQPSSDILNDIQQFRDGTGNDNLSLAAAYYPWLILNSGKKIPPSGAIAGIYAQTDSSRGVWKAPANVSVQGISGLTNLITTPLQDNMNVHESGKSINAIRFFTGKGFMVWGARTLNGNNNEWRYVPVRRFFNMVEESAKNATQRFVFEPNDANTWTRAKAMIENYLTNKWRDGALAGAKPQEAYYVHVGLGQTMNADDILNGIMIIEIGMAVVRPAEFIILRFSIKMQQS
jgi:uncharacterized protein